MNKQKCFNLCHLLSIIFVLTSCNAKSQKNNCEGKDTLNYIKTQNGCLFVKVFKSDSITLKPNLLIVIHGDAPFNPPTYQYKLSQNISDQVKNTIIVSVLRPGYKDNDGNKSDGKKGLTTGDNYTLEVISSLTEVIEELKIRFKPSKTIIVGHSGGAAISADIVSLTPNLINKTILVSCPCDVDAFRKSMAEKQSYYKAWRDSTKSISPTNIIKNVNQNNDIILLHGQNDDIVPFEIAENYFKKLKNSKIKVQLIPIANSGHEIFLTETVLTVLKSILNAKSD
jgi:pimeloyl-ACP methyl ester carboxylesterase